MESSKRIKPEDPQSQSPPPLTEMKLESISVDDQLASLKAQVEALQKTSEILKGIDWNSILQHVPYDTMLQHILFIYGKSAKSIYVKQE